MTYESHNEVDLPQEIQRRLTLESIFMPHARKLRDEHHLPNADHAKFVHYTSAENALKIIQSKRLWLRNTTCMADYREVQHGFEMLRRFFSVTEKQNEFIAAVEPCSPGAALEAIDLFNRWSTDIQSQTYIASISEHDDKENFHGRLSMWRAFGGNSARVAIVFKVPRYSEASSVLNILFSPVGYLSEEKVHAEIYEVMKNIGNELDFLRSIERSQLVAMIFNMLLAGVVCLKHEGFIEEREWRVIYTPKLRNSPLMEFSTETIGGVPQIVYKAPLDGGVSDTLRDLDLSRMFDRLIIGPSQYSWAMYQAFVAALEKQGVENSGERVILSGIPLRT